MSAQTSGLPLNAGSAAATGTPSRILVFSGLIRVIQR